MAVQAHCKDNQSHKYIRFPLGRENPEKRKQETRWTRILSSFINLSKEKNRCSLRFSSPGKWHLKMLFRCYFVVSICEQNNLILAVNHGKLSIDNNQNGILLTAIQLLK